MKEDAKGKTEEELAECFRIFDRWAWSPWPRARGSAVGQAWLGGPGVFLVKWSVSIWWSNLAPKFP